VVSHQDRLVVLCKDFVKRLRDSIRYEEYRSIAQRSTTRQIHLQSKNPEINQNLYSAPLRSILRGVPDPGQVEKNSLEKMVELRTGTVWEVP